MDERRERLGERVFGLVFGGYLATGVAGIALRAAYRPSDPHGSVTAIREAAGWSWLVPFHYWMSSGLLLVGGVALLYLVLNGGYAQPGRARYLGVVALLAAAWLQMTTGNLLPGDRHDVQTVVIEAGVTSRIPAVGPALAETMLGGDQLSGATFELWSQLHLALALSLLGRFFFERLLREKSSPYRLEFALPLVAPIALLALFVPGPQGAAYQSEDLTQYSATVSWYTWPLHGWLNALDAIDPSLGWLGPPLVLGITLGLLATLPFLGTPQPAHKLGLLAWVATALGVTFGFGGTPAPLTGNQDPPAPPVAKTSETPFPTPSPELIAKGRLLFTEQGCAGCHGIDGSRSVSGPDLTGVYERYRDPNWYVNFIRDPRSVRPSSIMPHFGNLTEEQLAALSDYLRATPEQRP